MTTKKKSITNAKVTKMQPKPKMPTKEEIFEKSVIPTLKSFTKASYNKLESGQEIIRMLGKIAPFYENVEINELLGQVNVYRNLITEYIRDEIEPVLNKTTFKTFNDINSKTFKKKDVSLGTIPDAKTLLISVFTEETLTEFLQLIKQLQRQLDNCE